MRKTLFIITLLFYNVCLAAIEGSLDPESYVGSWSTDVEAAKIIDINFTDTSWPNSWAGETKASYNSYAGATAAFCCQYYIGESAVGNNIWGLNNWKWPGHTAYLEENIETQRVGKKDVKTHRGTKNHSLNSTNS